MAASTPEGGWFMDGLLKYPKKVLSFGWKVSARVANTALSLFNAFKQVPMTMADMTRGTAWYMLGKKERMPTKSMMERVKTTTSDLRSCLADRSPFKVDGIDALKDTGQRLKNLFLSDNVSDKLFGRSSLAVAPSAWWTPPATP